MAKVKVGKKDQVVTIRQRSQYSETKQLKATAKTDKKKEPGIIRLTLSAIAAPFKWINRHLVPRYIRNAFGELRNIVWPTGKLSRQLTTAVILFAIVFAVLVSSLDFGLDKLFKKVFLHE